MDRIILKVIVWFIGSRLPELGWFLDSRKTHIAYRKAMTKLFTGLSINPKISSNSSGNGSVHST